MTKVISFLSACKKLKRDPKKLPVVKGLPKIHAEAIIAQYKLWTIADAIRDGWKPDYSNTDQWKWYAYFYFESAKTKQGRPTLVFGCAAYWNRASYVGSRLCFETRAQAEYFGKKFIKLHQQVHRMD